MSENTAKVTAYWWQPLQETSSGFILKLYADNDAVEFPVIKLFDEEYDPPVEQDFTNFSQRFPNVWEEIVKVGVDNSIRESEKFPSLKKKKLIKRFERPVEFIVRKTESGNPGKRVDWLETLGYWAGKPAGQQAGNAGELAYRPLTQDDHKLLRALGTDIANVAVEALVALDSIYDTVFEDVPDPLTRFNPSEFDDTEIFKTLFYTLNKQFEMARGAAVVPMHIVKETVREATNPFNNIKNGVLETLKHDLIDGHWAIETEEDIDEIIDLLGIKVTTIHKNSAEERVKLAKTVWLYADLRYKYGVYEGEAVAQAKNLFDEIPF